MPFDYTDWKIWAIVGAIILLLITAIVVFNRPGSETTGCACSSECTYPTVTSAYQDVWDHTICGTGCLIKHIEYEDIAGGGQYKITCACCDCVPESGDVTVGDCDYGNPLFDWFGQFYGLCKIGGN